MKEIPILASDGQVIGQVCLLDHVAACIAESFADGVGISLSGGVCRIDGRWELRELAFRPTAAKAVP